MLDYVNSLNQKRGVSRRTLVCVAASCLFHFSGILVIYMFPWLLAGGYLHQFRGFHWGLAITDEDMEQWRMVAVLESPDRMNMPSTETLRKILGLGDREEGAGTPPIEVSFGLPDAPEIDKPPLPQVLPKIENPEVVIPDNIRPGVDDETKPDTGSSVETPKADPVEPGTGRDIFAAKPEAASKIEIAGDPVPRKIPDGIQPPAPPSAAKPEPVKPAVKEPGGSSSIGLFDTGGFPMGDYKEIVENLVKAKWFIPSNLKNTFGGTIIVFYIDRNNGSVSGVHIEMSSGSDSLDRAALSAVYQASPFPPPPKGFPLPRVGARFALFHDP